MRADLSSIFAAVAVIIMIGPSTDAININSKDLCKHVYNERCNLNEQVDCLEQIPKKAPKFCSIAAAFRN
jgi:hypothetical protein